MCETPDLVLLNHLIRQGACASLTVDDRANTLMHLVQNAQAAKILLKAGANYKAKNFYGETPLEKAFKDKRKHIAHLLIEYGARE